MNKVTILLLMLFISCQAFAKSNDDKPYYSKHSHNSKHPNGAYGNPLVGTKMPENCKWVWKNGKKETSCTDEKNPIAKYCKQNPNSKNCKDDNNDKKKKKINCKKYPNHKKCKVTNVSEPAPVALLLLGLVAAYLVRRKP